MSCKPFFQSHKDHSGIAEFLGPAFGNNACGEACSPHAAEFLVHIALAFVPCALRVSYEPTERDRASPFRCKLSLRMWLPFLWSVVSERGIDPFRTLSHG